MRKSIVIAFFLPVLLLGKGVLGASQEDAADIQFGKSIYLYSHESYVNQWLLGTNPAGLFFQEKESTSRVSTNLVQNNQSIRRAMDPGEHFSFNVQTESKQTIGNFRVRGLFGYQNQRYDDLLLNGTMDFRHMNLYMLGDTVGGKQKQEGYFFNASAVYPLFGERLLAGINMDYEASVGAKIQDIRNLNTIVRATFTPGLIYRLNNLSIGLSGGYITETNHVEARVYMADRHTLFYHMGMGHYSFSGNMSGSETIRYEGGGYLAALELNYRQNNWESFHSLKQYDLTTDALVGGSFRLVNGITDYVRTAYTGTFAMQRPSNLQRLMVQAASATTNATEVRQETYSRFEDGLYRTYVRNIRWIDNKHIIRDYTGDLSYEFIRRGQDRPFLYQVMASAGGRMYRATHYPLEIYGFYEATTANVGLTYKHFFRLGNLTIDPSLGGTARLVLDSDVVYKPFPNYFQQVPELDFRFFSENYFTGKMGVTLSTASMPLPSIAQAFLDIQSSYTLFPDIDTSDNTNFSIMVSLGIIF